MEQFAIEISSKIVESTVGPVGEWLCYPFYYSKNIESMKNQVENLGFARQRVGHSIDAAIINSEEIEGDVKKWMDEVDKITKEASKVLKRDEEAKTKGRVRLNLKLRHGLSREAKKLVKDIGEILKNGKFDRVSYRPVVRIPYGTTGSCHECSRFFKGNRGIVTTELVDYVAYESRMSTVKRLMEALEDDNIRAIGVWGMAGVGKTRLVREVGRQAKEEMLLNEVVMASVTQTPDLRRIQGEIADMLDLKLDEESVLGRASRLRQRLTRTKDEKKILVILDDLWQNLDLVEIGIPSEGCKVLLTSRDRNVLTCEMDTEKNFGLGVLAEDEAWSLFEKMAGDCVNKDLNLRCTATEIAKECAGLPLTLITVSKALKNKSIREWKNARQQLRKPASECLTTMQSKIYYSIELSYKHLESKEAQYVLLLCAEMGGHILDRDLLERCYGLGLFHGINTMEDARNKVSTIVRILIDSGLLLQSPYSSQVLCMHDVVLYVARLIARRDHIVFGGDLPLPISQKYDGNMSVWDHNIYGGDGPLHISYMHGGYHNMYGGDRHLQVLDTNKQISEQLKETVEQLKEVAATFKTFNKGSIDANHLYEEIMKMEEYDEVVLASAFDHLMYDEKAARSFLAKNARLRKIWLEEFFKLANGEVLRPEKDMGFEAVEDAEQSPAKDAEFEPEKDLKLKPAEEVGLNSIKNVEELNLMKDIEEMKSKLDGLESKLREAEVTISKLTEERR